MMNQGQLCHSTFLFNKMYHLDCLLTKDQYAILEDALYYYSESKSESNDDAKVIAIEQLETLIEESARKVPV